MTKNNKAYQQYQETQQKTKTKRVGEKGFDAVASAATPHVAKKKAEQKAESQPAAAKAENKSAKKA